MINYEILWGSLMEIIKEQTVFKLSEPPGRYNLGYIDGLEYALENMKAKMRAHRDD